MSYTKNIYEFDNAIEVEEKHTYRYRSPGMKREKKKKLTPAQMKAVNQKNKEKTCRRKLRKHFEENDYFVCLPQSPSSGSKEKDICQMENMEQNPYPKRILH